MGRINADGQSHEGKFSAAFKKRVARMHANAHSRIEKQHIRKKKFISSSQKDIGQNLTIK